MNESVRPSSAFSPGLSINAPSGVLATIPNPPPEIARLPTGTAVRGVVLGDDGHGHVLVKTDLGTLSVATKANLAPDTEVILQLRSSGVQLHALIMQTRTQAAAARVPVSPPPGQPPTPATTTAASPAASASSGSVPLAAGGPSASAAQSPTPETPRALNLGQFIRAVVQGPPAGPGPGAVPGPGSGTGRAGPGTAAPFQAPGPVIASGLSPLPPGTPLQVRILSVSQPAVSQSAPEPLPAVATPGTALGTQAASQTAAGPNPAQIIAAGSEGPRTIATGPVFSQPASTPVPAGTPGPIGPQPSHHPGISGSQGTLSVGATATAPGPRAAPASPAVNGPQVVVGQIVGATHAGHPVIKTPLGTLTLEVRANLPTGGGVTLEVPVEPPPADTVAENRLSAPRSLAHAWPALEQALEALRDLPAPSAVAPAPAIPHTVPQPGPRLASGVLFVLAALTGGDIGAWLGADTLQALRTAGRGGLVDRLSRDLGQMRRMGEGVGSDWRLLPIPLWDGGQVRQVRLFLRQRNKRDGRKPGDDREPTRFILELEMSRLGEMQFDGLVRARRFDLMLRTRAPLPPQMREDIRQIFQDANDAAGYAGSLGFQASRDWRFVPVEQQGDLSADSGLFV